MAKGKSPTARSLERLRKEGYIAEVVEKTIPRCFIKKDFIGCIDIIAFNGVETIGVQATSGSNHAARRTKALAIPELATWLQGENRHFEVWSWTKPKTGRKWELRRERLDLFRIQTDVTAPMSDADFAYKLPHAQGCDPSVSPCHCDTGAKQ